jgi:hypothetical protein
VIKKLIQDEKVRYALFVLAVLLSRLPFIFNGYGLDGDSWTVASVAGYLQKTGNYECSRLPGFPVHEYLCSFIIEKGYVATNLLSAIASAAAAGFFVLILRFLRFKYIFLAGAAFACVPVFFIHSTTTIDYNIALAFVLAAMYFLLKEKYLFAGILLGFATGTRITSAAMIVPFIIMMMKNEQVSFNVKRALIFALTVFITALILYIPVLSKYGLSFFTYYNVPYPPIPKVLYKISIEVWGVAGLVGIIISTGLLFLPHRITQNRFLFPRSVNERNVIAWLVAVDLYVIAFLKLPMESGYLIPIIPFIIFIFGKYLYNKAFVFFCIMLIISPFVFTISPVERFDAAEPSKVSFRFRAAGEDLLVDIARGPVATYNVRRDNGMKFTRQLISSLDTINGKNVIVTGRWYSQLMVLYGDTTKLKTEIRSYLSEPEVVYFYAKGYTIYYLPRQDFYNQIMRNVDLSIYGALPYIQDEKY